MPRAKESLKVDIADSSNDETRTVTITLSGPAKEFLLADLLAQRNALRPLNEALKQSVREATEQHLNQAEDLIAGLAAGQKAKPVGEVNGTKARTSGNGKASQAVPVSATANSAVAAVNNGD